MASYGYTFTSGDTVTPTKLNNARTVSDIVNADIKSDAAIAHSKLASIPSGQLLIGNGSNVPTATSVTGDVTISNAGVTAITAGSIVTADLADAAVSAAKLDGAQSGSAPIYGCRAWVNFDGTTNADLGGTYSQSGTTITVTATAHNLKVGHSVYLDFTTGNATDLWTTVVTAADANTFTVTGLTSETTSGSVTLLRQSIYASGNVSTVARIAVGRYAINFNTSMADANYALVVGGPSLAAGSTPFVIQEQSVTGARSQHYISVWLNSAGTAFDENLISLAVFR